MKSKGRKIEITAAKVIGLKSIAKSLGFAWSDGADVKRTWRIIRKFNIPYEKEGTKIVVRQMHIKKYKSLVIGRKAIATFLGVNIKTLARWLKTNPRFRHMFSGDSTLYIERSRLWEWSWSKRPNEAARFPRNGPIAPRKRYPRVILTDKEREDAMELLSDL